MRKRNFVAATISLFIVYLLLALFSEYWLGIVTHHRLGEDFYIYYDSYIKGISGKNPYVPYHIGESFVNHPFVLSFLSLFVWRQQKVPALILWIIASLLVWIVVVKVIFFLVQSSLEKDELIDRRVFSVMGWVISLGFAPFLETMYIGQINVFVILSILLVLYYSELDKPYLAGFFLSLAIVLKTSPIIFVLYFLSLKNYRLLFGGMVSFALFSFIPSIQFSSNIIPNFLSVLSNLGSELHPSPYNESIMALSARLLTKLGWENFESVLQTGHGVLTVLVLCAILIPNLLKPPSKSLRLSQFVLLLLAMTLFSPLIWYHHSMFLIVPIILLLQRSDDHYSLISISLVLLIQLERFFEDKVINFPLPIFLAQYMLLGIMISMYFKDWFAYKADLVAVEF